MTTHIACMQCMQILPLISRNVVCTCVKLRVRQQIGASRGAQVPVGMATCRAVHRRGLTGGRMEVVGGSTSTKTEISDYSQHLALLADWLINEIEPAVIC